MKAHEIAGKAAELVGGVRDRQHGAKVANFENIANLWQAYLEIQGGDDLTGLDVAHMMNLLKIARTFTGEHNEDDAIDACGYAACAGEIAAFIAGAQEWAKDKVANAPSEADPHQQAPNSGQRTQRFKPSANNGQGEPREYKMSLSPNRGLVNSHPST